MGYTVAMWDPSPLVPPMSRMRVAICSRFSCSQLQQIHMILIATSVNVFCHAINGLQHSRVMRFSNNTNHKLHLNTSFLIQRCLCPSCGWFDNAKTIPKINLCTSAGCKMYCDITQRMHSQCLFVTDADYVVFLLHSALNRLIKLCPWAILYATLLLFYLV